MEHQIIAWPLQFFLNFPFRFMWLTYTVDIYSRYISASNILNDYLDTL